MKIDLILRKQAARHARGFTLIELMVSMLLGLLVVGGAIGVFIANRKTYAATESLGRIQESGRVGFELLARSIREADGTPCRQPQPSPFNNAYGRMLPVANILTSTAWWKDWGSGLRGYENGSLAGSLAGTDAIQVHSANTNAVTVASFTSPTFTLSTATHGLQANDVVMACDGNQGTIFQIAAPAGAAVTVGNTGNCGSRLLGLGGACGATSYTYAATANGQAMLAKVEAVRWYVGANNRGGNSLWRQSMGDAAVEIVDGIVDMELTYLLPGTPTAPVTNYVNATAVGTRWKDVKAVRVVVELQGQQGTQEDRIKAGTDGQGLRRQVNHVVTMRNRSS